MRRSDAGAPAAGQAGAGAGRPPDRFSPEPVEFAMGGSAHAVPANYLDQVATGPDGGAEVVTLRALWPGLEPLRRDNAHLWEQRQPARHVHVALMVLPSDGNAGPRDGSARFTGVAARAGPLRPHPLRLRPKSPSGKVASRVRPLRAYAA